MGGEHDDIILSLVALHPALPLRSPNELLLVPNAWKKVGRGQTAPYHFLSIARRVPYTVRDFDSGQTGVHGFSEGKDLRTSPSIR